MVGPASSSAGRRLEPRGSGGRAIQPRYWPVFDLASSQVVGAELVTSVAWEGSVPLLTRLAAAEFSDGAAAVAGWWVAVQLRPGQIASPSVVPAMAEVLHRSALRPEQLRLQATERELAHASRSGSAAGLADLGVRFAVTDFGQGALAPRHLRQLPIAHVSVGLAGLSARQPADRALLASVVGVADAMGVEVLAHDVETDECLELAAAAGVALVKGYRFGSAGPLPKLVQTWVRAS